MFSFHLPKWALVKAFTPDNSLMPMIHMGDGKFVSQMPPIRFASFAPSLAEHQAGQLPVTWDAGVFGEKREGTFSQALYDIQMADAAVRAAAAAGDPTAMQTVAELDGLGTLIDMVGQENGPQ